MYLFFIFLASCIYYQASAVYLMNYWWGPFKYGTVKEMTSSVRVPVGSDPAHTNWGVVGFNRGHVSLQRNDGTDRRIVFTVWNEAGQTKVMDIHPKGHTEPLGSISPATASSTYVSFPWQAGDSVVVRLTASPGKSHTDFTAYYQFKNTWALLARYRAMHVVAHLDYTYSFLQNLAKSKHELREGFYGNQTIVTIDGRQLTPSMTFTAQDTEKDDVWEQRLLENGDSYLRMDGSKDQGIYPPTNGA